MANHRVAFFLGVLVCAVVFAPDADGLTIASGKVGLGFIPDGNVFGGHANVHVGPFGYYTEFFKKSGVTTVNLGGNFIQFKVPAPRFHPYFGFGGGISRSSGGGLSRTRLMASATGGAETGLSGRYGLFGQLKYIYTFGTKTLATRELAIQAGLVFNLGI